MNNLREQLNRLRGRKRKSPGPDSKKSDKPVQTDQQEQTVEQQESDKQEKSDKQENVSDKGKERKDTLDQLRNLIKRVETRKPASPKLPKTNDNKQTPELADTLASNSGLLSENLIEGPGQHIEDLIPGEYLDTPNGPCFRVRTEYPWQYHQGKCAVSDLLDRDTKLLRYLTADARVHSLDLSTALFFDTETTGLDTGTGVYIFLAGFGYFEGRNFILEQYFMRDFPEEPAVLHAIEGLLKRFKWLVTYNGKTYDWPLLETRFIVNRKKLPDSDPPHLDLLPASRRFYKHRLENCKLTSVEAGVLDFHRKDDMPGALMPDMYYSYLRSRDARFIHKAFSHNGHDIVSMAAVVSEMLQFLADPYETGCAEDLYSYGRLMVIHQEFSIAEKAFRTALTMGLSRELYEDTLRRLSILLKQKQDFDEAVRVWETMITTLSEVNSFPFVELAKYLEHQARDFDRAHQVVSDALAVLDFSEYPGRRVKVELEHRLKRLDARKQGKSWRVNGTSE